MIRRRFVKLASMALTTPFVLPGGWLAAAEVSRLPAAGADQWISLMNGTDLSGWSTWLSRSGKGAGETTHSVTVEGGMLHLMGNEQGATPVEAGYLAMNQEFENVHIRVEYKWGMKRFSPRAYSKRDNGLLYHVVGPDRLWPTCAECQIEEGDVGDCFLLGGARGVQDPHAGGLSAVGLTANGWPADQGPPAAIDKVEPTGGRMIKDGDFEILDGWNTVEVILQGDRAVHIVNGRTVNSISKLRQPDPANPGKMIPLTRGRIAIEIEFAEIWYRRIEVKSLA